MEMSKIKSKKNKLQLNIDFIHADTVCLTCINVHLSRCVKSHLIELLQVGQRSITGPQVAGQTLLLPL